MDRRTIANEPPYTKTEAIAHLSPTIFSPSSPKNESPLTVLTSHTSSVNGKPIKNKKIKAKINPINNDIAKFFQFIFITTPIKESLVSF